ncbi:MAG: DUF58 domain-containing protein [Crocinitomicaceae bacterium]|nr:DUF58 domain-containing protein [Crocinitomicaceae bacterium]MDG1658217.1 DUF58 domain-containing protein [Crocinitomicaceae bacterium]|tara:strand:+ start:99 stop:965 length:867 start_codon:yes stop_codon:yes gene_type:complete
METKELLAKIRHLEIKAKGLTRHIFSGEYHSAFKGRGMTFSEVRDYHFGDEVRTIDWNVTARFNDPYVKVFDEERELAVMLIIDVSGSEDFGTGEKTKKDIALELTAVLAFSAISNNDKVGVIFVSDKIEKYIAPGKGRNHALFILREFIELKPESKGTNLNEALKFFRNTQKKRSIAFVMSDFIDENDFIEGLKVSRKKHDMVAIRLYDQSEETLPSVGIIQLFNAETGQTTWVNSNSAAAKETHSKNFKEFEEKLFKEFKRSGIDYTSISTDGDYIKELIQLFQNR